MLCKMCRSPANLWNAARSIEGLDWSGVPISCTTPACSVGQTIHEQEACLPSGILGAALGQRWDSDFAGVEVLLLDTNDAACQLGTALTRDV